jgi:hypothetical protein
MFFSGATVSAIFCRKDFLWDFFIEWRQIAAMIMDLKQTYGVVQTVALQVAAVQDFV